MIRRILYGLGAFAWGGFTYLVGLYTTFPADTARDRIVYEFGEFYRNEYALSIGDLAPWRLSGATGDDVTFYTVKKARRKPKDEGAPAVGERTPLLHFDSLSVRAAPLSMLMGKDAAAFVGEMYGGAIDGVFAQSEEKIELSFDAGDIDLGRMPVTKDDMDLKLLGVLSGEGDLTFDQTDVKNSAGFLRLSFEGLGLGADSNVAGFTLPEVLFTKAGVAFEVKDGKMEVTEGVFESEVLDAELTGDVVLNKKLARSRNRLELAFSLPEDLDKLAQISPDLKRSRDSDGKYHVNIGGTLLSPSVRFTRATVKRGGSVKDDGDGPVIDAEGPRVRPMDSLDDDERRRQREERIKERRERLRKRREEAAARNGGEGNEFEEKDPPEGLDEFDPDLPGAPPDGPGPRFPPEGPLNGPMDPMDGPMDMPPPDMDEGLPPDFEQNE